jgi:hypothetical protein
MTLKDPQGNFIGSPLLGETAYEHDWFSGSQINIYVGDVIIDTCVGIQWNVSQTKVPVYGYANQYYSFTADGKVMVQGALTIAFKEAGYLFWPIRRFLNRKVNSQWTTPRYSYNKHGMFMRGYDTSETTGSFASEAERAKRKKVMKASVEGMAEWQTNSSVDYNKFWKELGAMEDDQFEDWAEVFEDAIWHGSDTANPFMRDRLFSNNLSGLEDISEEDVLSHRRADQYPPIDVWITYGDMDRQAVNHTVRKIMDLSFVGQSQVIEVSGDPTYEVYNFIARNIV